MSGGELCSLPEADQLCLDFSLTQACPGTCCGRWHPQAWSGTGQDEAGGRVRTTHPRSSLLGECGCEGRDAPGS